MTRDEQWAFVLELTTAVQHDLQRLIDDGKLPADWNGIELRQLLADKFRESTYQMARARRRAYEQAVLEHNL